MTDRMLARTALPVRLALCAALLSLALGVLLSHALIDARPGGSPGAETVAAPPQKLLASQPLSIQAPVSAALGAGDPRYRVRGVSGGRLLARNPSQHLRVSFASGGVLLASGAMRVALGLHGVGFGSSLAAVDPVAPVARANRAVYERAGLSERYANGPLGLEQSFTVAHPPAAGAGPLTLSLTVAGNARAALAPSGNSILFTGHRAAALRYGGLAASDARGHTLHSWLELRGSHILLRVDTRGARYPVRIDPLAEQNLLTGQDEGLLGYGVALSEDGDTALVGAPKESGSAWVFVRAGAQWTLQQQLTSEEAPSTGSAETCGEEGSGELECGGFGRSVALSADGNTALIGAPRASEAAGSARVFVREGSSWKPAETLTAGTQLSGHFGKSVALSADGKTALVGAPSAHGSAGIAWVFTRQNSAGTAWSAGAQLSGGKPESAEAHFGLSVALDADGTTALIGAPTASGSTFDKAQGTTAHTANAGAAWVFTRATPEDSFPQTGTRLTIGGQQESEMEIGEGRLGFSVALSANGEEALLGARGDDEGDGAVWVFTRPTSGEWTQGPKLTAGGGASIALGYSVAMSGDGTYALLGSPKTGGAAGAAWLFTGSGSAWSEREELQGGADEDGPAWFGLSVALSGDGREALVGGPTDSGVGAAWPFGSGPAVNEVDPSEGPQSGGNEVTIKGVGFEEAREVKFGSNGAPILAVNPQGTEITTTAPAGRGKVFVTVKTPQGTSVASESAGDQYTYQSPSSRKADSPSPVVKSVSPDEGPAAGGTAVTIEGSNFEAGATVDFGSVAASSVKVEGTDTITVVSPAEPAGTVDVTVATPRGGTSTTKSKDRFTFLAPTSLAGATTGAGAAGASASAVALGFGPVTKAGCSVSPISRAVAVAARTRASVRLGAIGIAFSGMCKGRLTIEVKVRLKPTKGHKPRFGAKAVGTASFSLHAGKRATVTVKLNAAGRRLLRSHHGRLSAKLVILQAIPGPARAHSAIVHLAQQKPRAKHKPKRS